MAYVDTSIVVACYCPEALSVRANAAMSALRRRAISVLTEIEFCSALSLKVRTGALGRQAAAAVFGEFQAHQRAGYFEVVETGAADFGLARDWLMRFSTPLRALDAMHLAAAFVNSLEIVTADKQLYASARSLAVKCTLVAA